ncbi:TPA: hypothetical protein ACS7XF_000768 [Providencia alcalifaciens]
MPRIEILFDKKNSNKPSEKVRNALCEQVKHYTQREFINSTVKLSSYLFLNCNTSLTMK